MLESSTVPAMLRPPALDTFDTVTRSKVYRDEQRRAAAEEIAMLEIDSFVDLFGAEKVQRWLDGAIAIRQDPRRRG